MKFRFVMDTVVDARDAETALAIVSDHISTAQRHLGNGVGLNYLHENVDFQLTAADDDEEAVDLRSDPIVAERGAYPLNLDPESDRGIAHAEQQYRIEADRAEAERKAGMTDEEIMREHSAKEQATLNASIDAGKA